MQMVVINSSLLILVMDAALMLVPLWYHPCHFYGRFKSFFSAKIVTYLCIAVESEVSHTKAA